MRIGRVGRSSRNPGSTRSRPVPAHLFEWAQDNQVERLAIILPLDGSLTVAGEAVLAGAVEQLYSLYPNPSNRPTLSTINSAEYSSAKDAYQRALDEDPDLILGPLTKSEVASLSELDALPVPTILLNQIDTDTRQGQRNRISYSLALEDEAMQIADIAFGRGCRNAIVIAAAGDRGNRILTAFEPRWTQLGGKIRGKLVVEQPSQANKAMGELLGSGSSDDRIRAVETAFDLPVDARGRGRSDFECIFMLAPDPTTARAWRPLLVFHMTGDSPVYATSAINDGVSDSRNSDLNGVLFVEVPAMLPPHSSDRLSRLRALGQDALSLAEHWDQTVATDGWIIRGETGVLRRRQNGLIERASELAIFDGAKPRYETLP
ncbi:MAG: penicillin-binding protein activator [Halieaceae bacterium]